MQNTALHSVGNTQVFNGHVTEDMIYQEFVKMGMQDFVANDLSKRYYRNELTYKDIEYLESNFNLKLEMLERSLRAEIMSVKIELDNKIETKFNELDNKIETKFNELDKKIDINEMKLKSTLRLHNWMFGTIITICLGILLTLIFK
ncbi:Bdr family repetitive protein [Borrelia coriaceae]|uniref:Bdr family repetitive protein n=1 Tax=Borrelia coriaceae TaxID=144 RepID=UPI0004B05D77|nr:Bdr family repetitive protein [Borrelia coriaceae]